MNVVVVYSAGLGNGGMDGSVALRDSLLLVAALLLRDRLPFNEDDLGGGVGSGLSRRGFLSFLPTLSP